MCVCVWFVCECGLSVCVDVSVGIHVSGVCVCVCVYACACVRARACCPCTLRGEVGMRTSARSRHAGTLSLSSAAGQWPVQTGGGPLHDRLLLPNRVY